MKKQQQQQREKEVEGAAVCQHVMGIELSGVDQGGKRAPGSLSIKIIKTKTIKTVKREKEVEGAAVCQHIMGIELSGAIRGGNEHQVAYR